MLILTPHMQVIDQLAFGHDGKRLYAAGSNVPDLRYKPDNRGIDVWDLAGGPELADRLFSDRLIAGFAVNPLGRWLYVGTGYGLGNDEETSGYFAVDLMTGDVTRLELKAGNALILSIGPSGDWLVGAGSIDGWRKRRLIRWRQPTDAPPQKEWEFRPKASDGWTYHVACDPDGTRVITQESDQVIVREIVYELTVRDAGSGKIQAAVPIPGRTVDQLQFAPDGSWLVIRAGRSLLIWDARDFSRKPWKVPGGKLHFTGVAFHPSGRYLAATSNDTTVKLYDTDSWQVAKTFTWDVGRLRSIAFSPDGMLAAVGSDSGKIVVWDIDL